MGYPDPADVRSGVTFGESGEFTGTMAVPAASDTRYGTPVDNTTGTLVVPAASDTRYGTPVDNTTGDLVLPATGDVRSGTTFDHDASKTGTMAVPGAGDVRSGTSIDATAGTMAVPAASDTRYGTPVDDTTGTLVVPAASDTRYGTPVDNTAGTLVVPDAGDVRVDVNFDTASIGTLALGSDWTEQERSQIRHRLGIDGNATLPATASGTLGNVAAATDAIRSKTTVLPSTFPGNFPSLDINSAGKIGLSTDAIAAIAVAAVTVELARLGNSVPLGTPYGVYCMALHAVRDPGNGTAGAIQVYRPDGSLLGNLSTVQQAGLPPIKGVTA